MPNKDAFKLLNNPDYRLLTCLPSLQGTDEYEIGLVPTSLLKVLNVASENIVGVLYQHFSEIRI